MVLTRRKFFISVVRRRTMTVMFIVLLVVRVKMEICMFVILIGFRIMVGIEKL